MLGLGFSSRRRNRMNGTIQKVANGSMHIQVEESFGNCPKYIQVGFHEGNRAPQQKH